VLPPIASRSLAGIALVLGAALFVPSLIVLGAALVQWSPIGLGYGLVYLFVLAIPAVPLLVLGAVVWRRAAHRSI
jgi:membrane protein DedA with SNARE-associated domain